MEQKLKLLEYSAAQSEQMKYKMEIEQKLKYLQTCKYNLEKTERLSKGKLVKNTLEMRFKESATKIKYDHLIKKEIAIK